MPQSGWNKNKEILPSCKIWNHSHLLMWEAFAHFVQKKKKKYWRVNRQKDGLVKSLNKIHEVAMTTAPHSRETLLSPIVQRFFPRCLANGFQIQLLRCLLITMDEGLQNTWTHVLSKVCVHLCLCVCMCMRVWRGDWKKGNSTIFFHLPASVSVRCIKIGGMCLRRFTRHRTCTMSRMPWQLYK